MIKFSRVIVNYKVLGLNPLKHCHYAGLQIEKEQGLPSA
jgi:hypothetical protein